MEPQALPLRTMQADHLRAFAAAAFEAAGVPADQAADAAYVLVWANLHGVDTHGVRNLKPFYIDGITGGNLQALTGGTINAAPRFHIEYETPVTARVNGDNGLGMSGGMWAMRVAIQKARESGVGLVAMHNTHHFGAAGCFAMEAIPNDMIGIALTGYLRPEGMAYGAVPTFGARAMLSTNPISVAVPTGVELPFLLDMATTITPMNRVWLYNELGRTLPSGWGWDENREPTTDPAAVRMLPPLGGTREMGSHKGYGLAMVVEILCAQLSGGWKKKEDGGYHQPLNAHFFGAIRVDAFRPLAEFKEGMDAMIDAIHSAEPAPEHARILVAGDPEHATRAVRAVQGIPLPPNVVHDLETLAAAYNIPLHWD